jgi:Fe-S-cluster containining protein
MMDVPSCDNCGACCMGMLWPPFDDDEAIPAKLDEELGRLQDGAAERMKSGDFACVWFDKTTRRCKHYEHRPRTCRAFEPGCDICHEDRENYGIAMLAAQEPAP